MSVKPEKIEFRKVRDFGEVLNASFTFIRQNFRPVMRSLLLVAGPFLLVGSITPVITLARVSTPYFSSQHPIIQVLTAYGVNIVALLIGVVMAVAVLYEYILLYSQSNESKPEVPFHTLWKAVVRNFFRVLLSVAGLFVMLTIGGILLMGVLMALITPLFTSMMLSSPFLAGVVSLSVMLFVVALILFIAAPVLLVFFPAFLQERIGFFPALFRCFELVKGYWWQTFGLLVVCFIVSFSVHQIVWLPSLATVFFGSYLSDSPVSSVTLVTLLLVTTGIIGSFIYLVTLNLFIVVSTFQYFSLVERKESVGLLEKIQNMGSEDKPLPDDFYAEEERY